MAGVIFFIVLLCIIIHGKTKENMEDKINRKIYQIGGTDCYVDHAGATRNISNNNPVRIERDYINNETTITDLKTGEVINKSQKMRVDNYYKDRLTPAEHQTVSLWSREPKDIYTKPTLKGDRYKDLKNGRIYVKRYFNYALYYVDVETLQIVRRADEFWEMGLDKEFPNWKIQDAITLKEFNNRLSGVSRDTKIYIINSSDTKFNRIIPRETTSVF